MGVRLVHAVVEHGVVVAVDAIDGDDGGAGGVAEDPPGGVGSIGDQVRVGSRDGGAGGAGHARLRGRVRAAAALTLPKLLSLVQYLWKKKMAAEKKKRRKEKRRGEKVLINLHFEFTSPNSIAADEPVYSIRTYVRVQIHMNSCLVNHYSREL